MAEDLDVRLEKAVAERDRLAAEAQSITGRQEAAENALASVRKEISDLNLDPDNLEGTIETLESAYEEAVVDLEKGINRARESLKPFMENA